ncbi:MAG TPA: extracellular solute-binding protein [Xanthobacteraceae bacterium]|nr:extracellular solute-binding protein [Xanthobacteraceae bacterium]
MISRRRILVVAAGALSAIGLPRRRAAAQSVAPAAAAEAAEIEQHGISAFPGEKLKYPPDFSHFDYVNPDAPKGGVFSQIGPRRLFNQGFITFNSLNSYILKGDAAQGLELTFASLMARADDEPDAMYGFAARAVRISADGLTYRFRLRPEARFHDGSPLTAHDVAFSLAILKEKGHPIITQLLRDFVGAEALDATTVLCRFAPNRARDVPLFLAGLPIFSRAYYAERTFDATTLEPPLGSGPYKVARFEVGRFIEYERVKDWWGANLPVARGMYNFDVVRFEYYRDRDVAFEGFTAKNYLFREEFTSRIWATRYDFPALRDGRVKREVLPDETPSGAQGWFINTRRPQFKDRRLREALIYAFDFEWTNKHIMYGSYQRTHSVFQNSEMMAVGLPSAEELALLEPFRGKVPDEVFSEPFVPPVSDGSGADRALLRRAIQLLREAGYTVRSEADPANPPGFFDRLLISMGLKSATTRNVLRDPQGRPVAIEFLIEEPSFQPHHMPFIKNLAVLGIEASLRIVDASQMQKRRNDFDFDVAIQRFSFSSTPGDSLRSYFSSQAAELPGSQNLAGIADPAIDAMIERVIAAENRASLVVACRALDRLIRAGRYWIPHWYKASHWIAYWDVFGRPPQKPKYARGVLETWWYDREKAARIEQRG